MSRDVQVFRLYSATTDHPVRDYIKEALIEDDMFGQPKNNGWLLSLLLGVLPYFFPPADGFDITNLVIPQPPHPGLLDHMIMITRQERGVLQILLPSHTMPIGEKWHTGSRGWIVLGSRTDLMI